MSIKLLAGVRRQSKVAGDCTLAPDPRPAGSTLGPDPRGCALRGLASHGAGRAPYSIFVGKEKKQEFVWQIGKFRLSLQLKYKNNNNIY